MNFEDMIKIADNLVNPRILTSTCEVASVGCALLTDKGNLYTGIDLDMACGIGFCAEHSAIAQMVLNNETRINKIVAVGKNHRVIPPCGRCRELLYQIDNNNLETEILINDKEVKVLKEILPYQWK